MKRTALAYANQTRSYRIFEQCYMLLLDYFKPMLGRRKLQKAFEIARFDNHHRLSEPL